MLSVLKVIKLATMRSVLKEIALATVLSVLKVIKLAAVLTILSTGVAQVGWSAVEIAASINVRIVRFRGLQLV